MNHTSRFIRRTAGLSALLLAAVVTACSDATGPDTSSAARRSGYLTTSAAVYRASGADVSSLYTNLAKQNPAGNFVGDTLVQSFTVAPAVGAKVQFGQARMTTIAIPANVICDPARNTYGPTEWLKPCVRATTSITFTVRSWNDAAGHPHADFSPALRFDPSAAVPVRLWFTETAVPSNLPSYYIPYCDASDVCVNEGATDPALETYVSPANNGNSNKFYIYRIIRHFSGYNVTAF